MTDIGLFALNLFMAVTPVFLYLLLWFMFPHRITKRVNGWFVGVLSAASFALCIAFSLSIGGARADFGMLPLILALWFGGLPLPAALARLPAVRKGAVSAFAAGLYSGSQWAAAAMSGNFPAAEPAALYLWATYLAFGAGVPMLSVMLLQYGKELVEYRRASGKTERTRMISELGASVAHEIRNPLTAIRGFAELLHRRNIPVEKAREYAHLIVEEAKKTDDIIQSFLMFANPAGMKMENIKYNELLMEWERLARPVAEQGGVRLDLKPAAPGVILHGHRKLLVRSVGNIVVNSVESMPGQGTLTMTARPLGGRVVIEIADSGSGAPGGRARESLSGKRASPAQESGMELGMMMACRFIEAMNGKVQVRAGKNKNSKIVIWLCGGPTTPS